MSNQSSWSVDAIGRFLHHSPQTKNLTSIKKWHAHLLTRGLLFLSPSIQAKVIFSYSACVPRTNLQILTKLCKFLIPNRDPVPFNILISQFARNGFAPYALKTFSFMHFNGVLLDSYALCSTLTASSDDEDVIFGKQMHALVVRLGWSSSVFVNGALIDLYARSSLVDDAAQLFDEIPVKSTVCANALLSGYINAKMWSEGLKVATKMPLLNLNQDHFTLSAMLRASTGLSAVELGRQVHGSLVRTVYDSENDLFLQSSLIEMYGKCGLIEKACLVFAFAGNGEEGKNDLVLWTSMLDAYGTNGCYDKVIELYKEMLIKGIKPDEVAFVTVIAACARTGQVALGVEFFESIRNEYNVKPTQEHYSCLVDLLSRAGELDRAWKVLDEMLRKGFGSTDSMWGSLLNACLDNGNIELGKLAAQRALEWDPQNVGIYILLSNLYARFDMWDQIGSLRESMKVKGLKKDTGCSWIEMREKDLLTDVAASRPIWWFAYQILPMKRKKGVYDSSLVAQSVKLRCQVEQVFPDGKMTVNEPVTTLTKCHGRLSDAKPSASSYYNHGNNNTNVDNLTSRRVIILHLLGITLKSENNPIW